MSENVIKSICWDITSRCNDCCNFCYRNLHSHDLSLEENKIILKKLVDFGVNKISFVGGEPLLYADLFELLKWGKAYTNNRTVFSLTTNAILLTDLIENNVKINIDLLHKILELFDWITFSLDASSNNVQSLMGRNPWHFQRIITIMEYLNDLECHNKIKVNTILSAINSEYILDMYEMLCRYHVKRWKIFRFLPSRGSALEYKDKYYISEELFLEKVRQIEKCNADNKIKISVNGYDKFDSSYITISSEGKLVVYDKGQYTSRVDLLEQDVCQIFGHIDIEGHIKNRGDFLHV